MINNLESNTIDFSKFRIDHLNQEEKFEIKKLVNKYSVIFQQENSPLTFTNKIKHHIRTIDESPVYTKPYRQPEILKQEINKQVDQMLDQNIIRHSQSPWSSPVWIVPKKLDASGEKKFRTVFDYRLLNQKTIDDKYPIPNINDILDKLGRCQYFTTLDLASGFHQIEMHDDDIEKTAFTVENGHYEFLRMPFGLKNAPSTFQRVMDNVLRGLQNKICLVYVDDIIIFSTSLQEHMENLGQVFNRLKEANLKIQLCKCEFLRREVKFLGHIVTPDGIKPNPDKVSIIKNYPIPKTNKQIKRFLGMIGYYRKFIKSFAQITKPFTKCLKKGAIININDPEYLECFNTCKNLLTNEPILQYPDFTQTFHLTTDASKFAIGAVLSQGPIGNDRPICFASRTLNAHEINYSVIQKELLAVVYFTKYFRPYLYGRKFNIFTDHKPLQWLYSIKDPNSKLMRYRMKLEEFDYKIIYKKGCQNKVADPLSRIEYNMKETEKPIFDFMKFFNENFDKQLEQEKDDNASMIVQPDNEATTQNIVEDHPDYNEIDSDITIHSNVENPLIGIPILDRPINHYKNQIFIKDLNYPELKIKIKKCFNQQFQKFIVHVSQNTFEKEIIKFIKEYLVPNCNYYIYFESPFYEQLTNIIQKHFKNSELKLFKCTKLLEDVENIDDQKSIIDQYHSGKTNHRGIDETYNKLKAKYFWPKMQNSIRDFINECDTCRLSKYDRNPLKLKYNITPTASKPFETIHIDTLTLEKTKNKFKKEKLKEINTQLKTGKLETQTPQKTENIHLSNIKRPLKTTKFQSIPGPSSKSDNRQ